MDGLIRKISLNKIYICVYFDILDCCESTTTDQVYFQRYRRRRRRRVSTNYKLAYE